MDLYCCEAQQGNEVRAYEDPTLCQERILRKLLKTEDQYALPNCYYRVGGDELIGCQREVTTKMRKIVAEWMMEVCDEQQRQEEVYTLAMINMDRFLMCCDIKKNQLQLLGTTCMLLASKLRETKPLDGDTLVYYTDHSVTKHHLSHFELLVLSKLKWDIAAVTPQDFLRHLLNKLPVEEVGISYSVVLSNAKTLIAFCNREFRFSRYHPSKMACASIASALDRLGWTSKSGRSMEDLLQTLSTITNIEKDFIKECLDEIEHTVRESERESGEVYYEETKEDCEAMRRGELTPPPSKNAELALTPTDVHDIHF